MALRCPSIQRPFKALAFLALAFFLLHSFHLLPFSGRPYDTWAWTPCPPGSSPFKESCNIPRASIGHDLQIIVKTGGSEPLSRLRYQLKTLLSEVPRENLLILSDLEEDIGEYHIYDIYADVSEKERKNYPEFTLYDEQLAYKAQGNDTRELKGGWQLDKYKNLPMKRKIWKMQQEHTRRQKWFIFIDTDTYVEWDNLFGLLEHLDPSDELYIGSPVWTTEQNPDFKFEFAHGGSAYVLSYGALEALNTPESYEIESPMYSQYGLNVTALCCGDEAVSRVLLKKGIRMKGYWPLFNGETPATVPFGMEHWCEPVISLHHISEENLDALWHWILDWKHKTINQVRRHLII